MTHRKAPKSAAAAGVSDGTRDLGRDLAEALVDGRGRVSPGPSASGDGTPDPVAPGTILVAWSGGLDSTVLLDLIVHDDRVRAALGDPDVVAAHLDHAMRPDSRDAAAAIRRTAEAWGVDLESERLPAAPVSEEDAREQRYRWLSEVADEIGAEEIWTAHHGDDQAETVLFRILRGTGVAGLAGIPVRRGRIRRPLLMLDVPVRRTELARYAEAHRLPVQPDATNEEAIATRNRLRHEVMPLVEEIVPGAVGAILRLARNASRAAAETDALAELVLRRVGEAGAASPQPAAGGVDAIPASVWEVAGRPLRRALVRHLADRAGVILSEAATRAVLDLPPGTQSGRGVDLPGGLRFEREFGEWRLFRPDRDAARPPNGERVVISRQGSEKPGRARLGLGGRAVSATWAVGEGASELRQPDSPLRDSLRIDVPPSSFPLTLRAWEPGDRIALEFGTTPVAKVWAERRVPRRERARRWVLVDRKGTVFAAEGLGAASRDRTIEGSATTPVPLYLRLDVEE